MNITVVIPLKDEAESLPELTAWIKRVMEHHSFSFETILVDDGSKDDSWKVIQEISNNDHRFKGIKFKRNYGKSAALNVAFREAKGDVVITMDADLQDSPDEIPSLYSKNKGRTIRFGQWLEKEALRQCFDQKYSFQIF